MRISLNSRIICHELPFRNALVIWLLLTKIKNQWHFQSTFFLDVKKSLYLLRSLQFIPSTNVSRWPFILTPKYNLDLPQDAAVRHRNTNFTPFDWLLWKRDDLCVLGEGIHCHCLFVLDVRIVLPVFGPQVVCLENRAGWRNPFLQWVKRVTSILHKYALKGSAI